MVLIILYLTALLGMTGGIYYLDQSEQVYYEQSNILISMKSLIQENKFREIMMSNGIKVPVEQGKTISELDRDLMDRHPNRYNQMDTLISERNSLKEQLLDNRNNDKEDIVYQKQLTQLKDKDDDLLLLIDNIVNDLEYKIARREDQEPYVIISGILLIISISIWAAYFLGRSIIRPIKQLRSHVLSLDLEKIQYNKNNSPLNDIDTGNNLEVSQLAEFYRELEEFLFNKTEELKEKNEALTRELKGKKKTEGKLKQNERYINNIIQSLNSLVITADSKGILIHWNKLAEDLSEQESNTLYNRFPFLKNFEHQIESVMDNGSSWTEQSIQIDPLKNRYFNISITPLAGKRSGVIIHFDDITQIRNIKNQLMETQKWETIGILTSGFAHDFNNVLTGIVTSSSILLHMAERDYTNLDETFINCLSIIDRSGNRAVAMVKQLLSLSRTNELNFSTIDLRRSIEETKAICKNSFDKSVNFILEMPEERVLVEADNAQLEQILLNLCINAYHAMTEMRDKKEKQGGELKISLMRKLVDRYSGVEEKGCKPGMYARISISDNGVGIPPDKKEKIFEPFFTTKDKSKGTGLGLTMVQHIAKQHNGFLELYSEESRGTIISVYLPLSPLEKDDESFIRQNRKLVNGEGHILVIDDEEVLRVLSQSILKECGYIVTVAEDGFKGVDLYRKNNDGIDLIILDMSMPGISGKETFIELKQINPEVKILLASGFIKDDRIQDLLNLGLEDFIQKPFDFIELSEKVDAILKKGIKG